jgi:hypothetical protein
MQGRIQAVERDLEELRKLLPDLQAISIRRRRSAEARMWLIELVPGPVRRFATQIAPALTGGLTVYGLEHGWIQAITRFVLER